MDRREVPGVPEAIRPLDGPLDDEVLVLTFEAGDGRPLVQLMNFACHPVILSLGRRERVSCDYPGVATRLVEQTTGAPCLFLSSKRRRFR